MKLVAIDSNYINVPSVLSSLNRQIPQSFL